MTLFVLFLFLFLLRHSKQYLVTPSSSARALLPSRKVSRLMAPDKENYDHDHAQDTPKFRTGTR